MENLSKPRIVVRMMLFMLCAVCVFIAGCSGSIVNTNGTKTFSKDPERELRECLSKVTTTHKIHNIEIMPSDKNKDGVGSIIVSFESNASEFLQRKGITHEFRNVILKDVNSIAKEIAKYKGLDDKDTLTIEAHPLGQPEGKSYYGPKPSQFIGEIAYGDLKNHTSWNNINIDAKLMKNYEWNRGDWGRNVKVTKDEKYKTTTLGFFANRGQLRLPAEWYNNFYVEREFGDSGQEIRFYLSDSASNGNDGLLCTYSLISDSYDYKQYKHLGYYRGTFFMYRLTGGHIFYKPEDINKFSKQYQEKYAGLFKQIPAGYYLFENLENGRRDWLHKF